MEVQNLKGKKRVKSKDSRTGDNWGKKATHGNT